MTIKTLHIALVFLTFISFSLRAVLVLLDSTLMVHRLVRILPHVIDTCLFASGLIMALRLYPAFYTQTWLLVKLLAIILYIVAGSIALSYGRTRSIRICALIAAWLVFIYIVMVALTHSPIPYYMGWN